MKTSSKIALALGAVVAFLFVKKKQAVSGIGAVDWDHAAYIAQNDLGIDFNKSFFELTWSQIDDLVLLAKRVGYRRSYDNGKSYGRAFYDALKRKSISGVGNIDDIQYSILEDAAKKYNAEIVETTSDRGGYPRGLGYALTGFETFEQAEQAAKELHGEVVRLMTKNGWHFYYNDGWIHEPLNSIFEEIYYDDPEFATWHYPEYCTKKGELRKNIPDIMSVYYDTTTWQVGVVTDFSYLDEGYED